MGCCLILIGCGSTDDQAERDGKLVRCLSDSARQQVVTVAVTLELAQASGVADQVMVDQRQLTLDEWRKDDPDAFDRACEAYLAASDTATTSGSSGSGGFGELGATVLTTVLALLVAALTAVVGGMVTVWVGGRDRRRVLARELRSTVQEFQRAGKAFADGFLTEETKPTLKELFDARLTTDGKLQEVEATHPGWRVVVAIRAELERAPLDDNLIGETDNPSQPAVEEVLRQVGVAVEQRTKDVLWLAEAIEAPVPSIRRLRGDNLRFRRTSERSTATGGTPAPGAG